MRGNISNQLSKSINGIRLLGTSRSSNIVELSDAQTFQAIRVFEFNEQSKEEFDRFVKKLEPIILRYSQENGISHHHKSLL